jgi:hypothetical protein
MAPKAMPHNRTLVADATTNTCVVVNARSFWLGGVRREFGIVSKLIHRVWPAADVTPFITALLLGVSAYGFFKLSELIF